RLDGIVLSTRMLDRKRRTLQPADAPHLTMRVRHLLRIDRLLRLENRVDALSQHDRSSLELEDDRRILSVENDNVDLLAEAPLGIHDVGLPGLVSPGQVSRQQVDPNGLARISLLDRMAQYRPGLAEPPFDVVMQAAQQRRERP